MKSRNSRRISRAARRTRKAVGLGLSLTKTTQKAAQLGIGAGVVIGHRSPIVAAAMNAPATMSNPEIARMGSEKAVAAMSVGMGMIPNLFAMQFAWMKFVMIQANLARVTIDGVMRASSPLAAARAWASGAQRAMAGGVDAGQSLAQSSRAMADRAMKPLQAAVSANAKRLSQAA